MKKDEGDEGRGEKRNRNEVGNPVQRRINRKKKNYTSERERELQSCGKG